MLHPALGVLGVLAAVWVFVEALNARDENLRRCGVFRGFVLH